MFLINYYIDPRFWLKCNKNTLNISIKSSLLGD